MVAHRLFGQRRHTAKGWRPAGVHRLEQPVEQPERVFGAFRQGRDRHFKEVKPVEEVGPETAIAQGLGHVRAAGGNQPGRGGVFQPGHQAVLPLGWQPFQRVEKQRAFPDFGQPAPQFRGALGPRQGDGDEGGGAAVGQRVDASGDQRLAGSRRTAHQNGTVHSRRLRHQFADPLGRGRDA
jgi:hypothetical protein